MTYQYLAHPNFTVSCVRKISVGSDRRIHCEENRVTSWEPVIYSPASRIFGKESEALEWCIDQAETRIRDLTRTLFHVHDREADERAEQFPNEEEAIPNETVGIIPTATTPTEASPDVPALGVEAASHQFNSPADVPPGGAGERCLCPRHPDYVEGCPMCDAATHAHELKTWPPYFDAIDSGRKTFEIRKLDRDYRVGDRLLLREWKPETEDYTGRRCSAKVTFITTWEQREGYGVLGIKREPLPPSPEAGR